MRSRSRLVWVIGVSGCLLFVPGASGQGAFYSHGEPTVEEQYMLELINAARANPAAEAARLGIDLNQDLPAGTISAEAKPPLALQSQLITAARGHSDWMLSTGIFDHTGKDGTTPSQRATGAGFAFPVAENIGYRSTNRSPDYRTMTRLIQEALFESKEHRPNLMAPTYGVVGLGLRVGKFGGGDALMGTQKFSSGGPTEEAGLFIVGVCYEDRNGNGAYDPGEGLGSVRVETSLGTHYAVTGLSGGYAIPVVPVATNSATVNLPFPVSGSSWTDVVEPQDTAYRAERIAAAPPMDVEVRWSGGPLSSPVAETITLRRPVRLDYRLTGTDNFFYDRTMVTAQNVKRDLPLRDGMVVSSPISSVKLLPARRTIRAGKTARLIVKVANNSTATQEVEVTFVSSDENVLRAPGPLKITARGKKNEKRKARWSRGRVVIVIDESAATGRAQLTASVGGRVISFPSTVTIKPRPER